MSWLSLLIPILDAWGAKRLMTQRTSIRRIHFRHSQSHPRLLLHRQTQSKVRLLRPGLIVLGITTVLLYTSYSREESIRITALQRGIDYGDYHQSQSISSQMQRIVVWKKRLIKHIIWMKYHGIPISIERTYTMLALKYISLSDSELMMLYLIAANTVVFLAWQIPRLRPFMWKHFTHYPLSGKTYTMATSMFSHKNVIHYACNMISLYSFGTVMCNKLGPESFLTLYFSAGFISFFVSHAVSKFKILSNIGQHLGASGGIYSCLIATAVLYPTLQLSIIFLPHIPMAAATAIPLMLSIDALGIIRGWRILDHWAHLGGAAFGYAYVETLRQHLIQKD